MGLLVRPPPLLLLHMPRGAGNQHLAAGAAEPRPVVQHALLDLGRIAEPMNPGASAAPAACSLQLPALVRPGTDETVLKECTFQVRRACLLLSHAAR